MVKPVEPLFKDAFNDLSVMSQSKDFTSKVSFEKGRKGSKPVKKMQSSMQDESKLWKTQTNFN